MDDLAAFLKARLDEVEAAAMLAAKNDPAPWTMAEFGELRNASGREVFGPGGYEAVCFWDCTAQFIAQHDPARVLREVEAKRAILGAYESQRAARFNDPAVVDELRDVVQTLASVYRDHPDYREKWKP